MLSNDQGRFFQCVSHRRSGECDLCASPADNGMAVIVARAATSPAKLSGQVEYTACGAAAGAGQGESTLAFDDAGAAVECATTVRPMALDAAGTTAGTA